MDEKAAFNATICILGIGIFLVHTIDLLLKKDKRKDEKNLLAFFLLTIVHFGSYLGFTLIKVNYTSDAFIMGSYTAFYIFNNLEAIFLFAYAISYIKPKREIAKVTTIVNLTLLTVFIALDLANIFGHFFFYPNQGKYERANLMLLSQGYQLIVLTIVFFLAITDKKLSPTEKTAFGLYCFLPLLAIVLQNLLPGYAIAYLSIVISIEILFLFANVRKNAALAHEEKKNKEAEIRLMMSQIQPHFIYNSLSSISTLIKINPDEAQKALDNFTEYLRANLSSLSDTHCIAFSDELRHIETYVSLEEVRFGERVHVVFDIQDNDFLVPPLSIQPLVENALKHGILKRLEGGTAPLKTYATEEAHIVEIIDDGVGFDADSIDGAGSEHVGLRNVSRRIASMSNGEIEVESTIGKGTRIVVTFHKEEP